MNLSTLRTTLEQLGAAPVKSLGQNFLHDQNLARWIVDQLGLEPEDHLVEIGPGLGALSEFALPQCASATLIEKDGRLADYLRGTFASERVEVRHEDALDFDVRTLFPRQPVKVLGNLPYYVTSPILFAFGAEPSPAQRMVFTVQREMAERLAAQHGSHVYGQPTVLLGRRWRIRLVKHLSASVFLPNPKVQSSVITLDPREPGELPDCEAGLFQSLVKRGFSQRRKQMRKLIGLEGWPDYAKQLGVSETARAEQLSIGQWVELARLAGGEAWTVAQDVHRERFDVVNERDEVVRVASRHEVHEGHLPHRAIHVFVFNERGELFLQKRSRHKDRCAGLWDSSAAGHVEAGCDYEETAVREVKEELGVEASVERVARLDASAETGREFVGLYRARHDGPFWLPPAEIECGGFFPVELIDQWIGRRPEDFAGGFLACYKVWRSKE